MRGEGQLDVKRSSSEVGAQLAVDVDFPARLAELRRGGEFGEVSVPDVEKIIQGEVAIFWRFDVDDAVVSMGVHPVDATTVGGNADAFGNGVGFAVDIHGEMDVNMVGELFSAVTGDAVGDGIGGVEGDV